MIKMNWLNGSMKKNENLKIARSKSLNNLHQEKIGIKIPYPLKIL